MTVWDRLVGQRDAAEALAAAAAVTTAGSADPTGAMTHAWLITGPPGSGRSVAGEAFAAALVCPDHGCGHCAQCRAVVSRSHPDVDVINPEGLSYRTGDARALAGKAAYAPTRSAWHVIVLEDADRLTETANNVLLKSIEEPPPRTVWVLCAPGVDDVLPTIRSRCRHLQLRTPTTNEVAQQLVEVDGVDPDTAAFAARAAQGHVGRARALALDEGTRARRQQVLGAPHRLTNLAACLEVAAELVDAARTETAHSLEPQDAREREDLLSAWGEGAQGRGVAGGARGMKGALKELEQRQNSRRTRRVRDHLDRELLDLLSYYRDVMIVAAGAAYPGEVNAVELINEELRAEIEQTAANDSEATTMVRVAAIERARLALAANVTPQLALEALMIDLRNPGLRGRIADLAPAVAAS